MKTRRYETPVAPARQSPPKAVEAPVEAPAKVQQVEAGERGAGQRLDNFLARFLKDVPKTHIFRVIRKGEVRVNGKRAKPEQRLLASDIVRVPPVRTGAAAPPRRAPPAMVQGLIGAIIYEDPRLLVIDKPAGIAVHGGSGVSFGVIEGLRAARPDETLELVHRIDRDTSGLLMIARKPAALRALHALMRDGKVEKRYLALVKGKWELGRKRIDVPLRTDIRVGGERTVKAHESGKEAVSVFKPVQFFGKKASLQEMLHRCGAMPLRQARLVRAQDQWHVAELGDLAPQCTMQKDLLRRVGKMVFAAQHVSDAHIEIIDRRREVIGGAPVRFDQHKVAQVLVAEGNFSTHQIDERRLPFRNFEDDRMLASRSEPSLLFILGERSVAR